MNMAFSSGFTFSGDHLKIEVSRAQNGFIAMVDSHRWVFQSFKELSDWVEKSLDSGISWSGQG